MVAEPLRKTTSLYSPRLSGFVAYVLAYAVDGFSQYSGLITSSRNTVGETEGALVDVGAAVGVTEGEAEGAAVGV